MDELLYPPRTSKAATPPVDAVRGFVFLSGLAWFRKNEHATRYLEFWRCALARSPFFVTSMRGAIAVGFEGLCDRMLVTDVPELLSDDGFALRLAW